VAAAQICDLAALRWLQAGESVILYSLVQLEISDDGVGFDPSTAAARAGPVSYGLPGMQERVPNCWRAAHPRQHPPAAAPWCRLRIPIAHER
jgi:hypothetical protein